MTSVLPYGRHAIDDDDVAAVVAALRGDWLSSGPTLAEFERRFAELVGVRHAVVCNSGTAALHLGAMALGLGPGDAVVVPSVTFLATANAARYVGAEVIFADVEPDSGLLTAATLAAALERGGAARAVFPVHLAGQCVDMAGIAAVAAERGLEVMEDACHALGSRDLGAGAMVGACSRSRIAAFSFHPVKTIAMGEGGMATTNDAVLAERMARYRSHGMVREPQDFRHGEMAFDADGGANPWYYEMPEPGFNYRPSDLNCALGISQLAKLGRFVARRRALAERYDALLAGHAPLLRPIARHPWSETAWHLYAVLIDFAALGIERARLMRELRERGIGTQVHYIPVHRQPYYRERYGALSLPGADAYYDRTLSLPLFPAMTDDDVDRVAETLLSLTVNRR